MVKVRLRSFMQWGVNKDLSLEIREIYVARAPTCSHPNSDCPRHGKLTHLYARPYDNCITKRKHIPLNPPEPVNKAGPELVNKPRPQPE
jgi:hypothetical protein